MKSLWSDSNAEAMIGTYAAEGTGRDIALRVYTSRLLGGDTRLVLHGGGNTSVKTTMTDITGEVVDVLCIKGSGWNLGDIEPRSLPAVRLEPLQRLLGLDALTDEEMVNVQRANLMDSTAPNPSVETLLHAFLPHKFIDHTHADAVLAISNQPDGEAICEDVFGDRVALVPYIMPGFALARRCAELFTANAGVEGLILLKHGIFSMGETAREAYERMIELTSLAERHLESGSRRSIAASVQFNPRPSEVAPVSRVAPILRGLVAGDDTKRMILDFRSTPEVLDFIGGAEAGRYAQAGPITPDHVIRTKPKPLFLSTPSTDELDKFKFEVASAIDQFRTDYQIYFENNNLRQATPKITLDSMPRVIMVPGLGLFGLGNSAKAAAVTADLAETTVRVVTQAEGIGTFESITESDIFDIEYWSLEQAKLGKTAEKPLARHVVAVTGGASGIGLATVRAFRAQGAEVAILDRDYDAADEEAAAIGAVAILCDVTDADSVSNAFDCIAATFGGLDILVSNAGAAWQGRIGEVDEVVLRESFELNFYGHQRAAQAAVQIMQAQDIGGALLFNTSKQAINPGPEFGPYGLPKAATLFLMRQYALDHGLEGIRANAVNADRIRTGLLTDAMIKKRSKARGVSPSGYMSGNLLGREVTVDDVARAFVDLAMAEKTTGAVLTVDGGNIAAALR